ncbi:MAG: uncharacterized protein KVP18_000067 [Porospora cf. gigantea A]|uniref:uncharacterized protein n=1 Tax=Porospora cf. gigantea A TaxID=2853593 RepID=UPI00355AAC2D|nr:MAG: hypothetical protein KVP18_000067 [Porospora cf. gigantea A]
MQDLFGQFQETTDADDYRCDKCGFKGTATKSTLISSPPAHIFAVMTRYAYDVDSAALIKLMTRVSLSPVLVVSGWLYDMYAVVVHAVSSWVRADSGQKRWFGALLCDRPALRRPLWTLVQV